MQHRFNAYKMSIRRRDVVQTSYRRWKEALCLQGGPFYSEVTVFLEGHVLLVLFYPVNLIVSYPLKDNKPELLAIFENWGLEVAK